MKNKKILISVVILVSIIFLVGFFVIKYLQNKNNIKNEYIPEQEISEEQLRETIVTLYFLDVESNTIKPEARLVSVKELLQSPYLTITKLLIEGPKNNKFKKVIPDNTKILNASIQEECLVLDFSNELLNYNKQNSKEKDNIINTIVNTLTELTEVNKVKFLVNGQINEEFKEEYIRK